MYRHGKFIVEPAWSAENVELIQQIYSVKAGLELTTEALVQLEKKLVERFLKEAEAKMKESSQTPEPAPVKDRKTPILIERSGPFTDGNGKVYPNGHASRHLYQCPKCDVQIRGSSAVSQHIRKCRARRKRT